jgi:hypothetical protein
VKFATVAYGAGNSILLHNFYFFSGIFFHFRNKAEEMVAIQRLLTGVSWPKPLQ